MRGAALPAVAGDMLESLHFHRLLTARQLRMLYAPAAGSRWTEKVMALLLSAGLVDFVRRGGGARRIYFLTADGYQALQLAHPHPAGSRRGVDDARHAASALSAHTLAVNDVGLAFVAAARERGDEFGPLAWRHEIAHPIGTTAARRAELVIADAVLTYLQQGTDGALRFHYRFLELDRATQPTAALAAKLSRYARLFTYTTKNNKEPQWHQTYPVFPEVLVVLTNAPAAALRRRAQTVLALCQADALLQHTRQVAISITTLETLLTRGPWAAIFQRLHVDRPATWTGEAA
jgi:hypothetical protein